MSEKECSQKGGEERLVGEGQCTPGTVEAEHAGRDSVLSRQAVEETEVTVVGRDETTGTDAEVDVGGVSAGPSPVRAGTGLGVRARAETVMTVPSSARVGSEGVCVSPGVGTVAGPSSARVTPATCSGEGDMAGPWSAQVDIYGESSVAVSDVCGTGSESEGLTLADWRRTGFSSSAVPEASYLSPCK